jgi:capsular exopolysaccharide synthesis family protein
MSRIFDALQRSGVEESGVEYPDLISVVTEVFEAKRTPTLTRESSIALPELDLPPINLQVESAAADKLVPEKPVPQDLPEFPALTVSLTNSSRLVFFTEPDSLAAEKLRFLGVRLRHIQQTKAIKKLLVTSTIPEEGKSFIAANLAGVLARRKQKVLLIEGDLRRPALTQQFGIGQVSGLGEWLQGNYPAVSNLYRLNGPGFWFLPAGTPPSNPLELMQSGNLSRLMSQLATMFDWIIVDSPPLLPLADTTVWVRLTDGVLLVARQGVTQKTMLQRGLETIKKSELIGVVMNGCTDSNVNNYYQAYAGTVTKAEKRSK